MARAKVFQKFAKTFTWQWFIMRWYCSVNHFNPMHFLKSTLLFNRKRIAQTRFTALSRQRFPNAKCKSNQTRALNIYCFCLFSELPVLERMVGLGRLQSNMQRGRNISIPNMHKWYRRKQWVHGWCCWNSTLRCICECMLISDAFFVSVTS